MGLESGGNLTYERLMSAALREFAERGYEGASTESIVQRAKVKKPTLYYYFGSKAGLFKALIDRAYEQGVEFLRDAAAPSVTIDEKLFRIASSALKFTRTHPDLVRLTFLRVTMPLREQKEIAVRDRRYEKGFELLHSIMHKGIRAGELAGTFTGYELTIAFAGSMNAVIIRYLRGEPGPSLNDRLARRMVQVFMEGAAPRKRISRQQ
jgi:AcrR family transcriptional regulator